MPLPHSVQRVRNSAPAATAVALIATVAVGILVAVAPLPGLVLAAALASVCLAASLHIRFGLSPMWLVGPAALLQPLNGIRPFTSVTVGDLALVLVGVSVLPFIRRAQVNWRLVVPFIGVLFVIAGGLFGGLATEGTRDTNLLSGLNTLSALNQSGALLGASDAGGSLLRFILGAPCVIAIIAVLDPPPRVAANLGRLYALGAAVSAVAGVVGYNENPYYQRAVGFAVHFLHFGLTSLFGFAVAVGWYASATRRASRITAVVIGSLCLYGVLLSGARSALIGAVVVILYFAALARGRGLARLLGFAVVSGVALYFASPYFPQGSALNRLLGTSKTSGNQVSGSNAAHLDALHSAIAQIGSHPWTGTGFAAGLLAHNLELEAADIGGIVAFVGIVLVWGTVFWLLWRQLRYGVPRADWLRASLLVGVLGYFSLAQFENIFWDRHLWFFVAIALVAAPSVGPPSQPDPEESGPPNMHGVRRRSDTPPQSVTV